MKKLLINMDNIGSIQFMPKINTNRDFSTFLNTDEIPTNLSDAKMIIESISLNPKFDKLIIDKPITSIINIISCPKTENNIIFTDKKGQDYTFPSLGSKIRFEIRGYYTNGFFITSLPPNKLVVKTNKLQYDAYLER